MPLLQSEPVAYHSRSLENLPSRHCPSKLSDSHLSERRGLQEIAVPRLALLEGWAGTELHFCLERFCILRIFFSRKVLIRNRQ